MHKIVFVFLFFALFLVGCDVKEKDIVTQEVESMHSDKDIVKANVWTPAPGTTWQWQLDGEVDTSVSADVFGLDLAETDASTIKLLHDKDKKVICYVNVGTWEEWRDDADKFPVSVIGKAWREWEGEKWLDISNIEALSPVISARFDECKNKGFDAIEPDNIDIYSEDTGFDITYEDQIDYNIWLANEAHKRNLSIGLKNNPEQAVELFPYFDWALTEDCFKDSWCFAVAPFITAGKAVFSAEYTDRDIKLEDFCPQAKEMQFSAILKNRELDAYREECKY